MCLIDLRGGCTENGWEAILGIQAQDYGDGTSAAQVICGQESFLSFGYHLDVI